MLDIPKPNTAKPKAIHNSACRVCGTREGGAVSTSTVNALCQKRLASMEHRREFPPKS